MTEDAAAGAGVGGVEGLREEGGLELGGVVRDVCGGGRGVEVGGRRGQLGRGKVPSLGRGGGIWGRTFWWRLWW